MTAPTPTEQATLDRIDAAPDAEESLRERVARAIAEARRGHTSFAFPCRCGWEAGFGRGWEDRVDRHQLMATADAAIATMRGQA